MSTLIYTTQIRLHHTDAAGLLFFGNQFHLMHDAYEHVLESLKFSFRDMLKRRRYFLPIVHAEADYKKPLAVGDQIEIHVQVAHIGRTSFSFTYEIYRIVPHANKKSRKANEKICVGTGKTVHVTINKSTHQKMTLPKECRNALEHFQNQKRKLDA